MDRKKITKKKAGKDAEAKLYDKLYGAVADYVKFYGGSVVVIGGTALVDEGNEGRYGVMVRCMGTKPIFRNK